MFLWWYSCKYFFIFVRTRVYKECPCPTTLSSTGTLALPSPPASGHPIVHPSPPYHPSHYPSSAAPPPPVSDSKVDVTIIVSSVCSTVVALAVILLAVYKLFLKAKLSKPAPESKATTSLLGDINELPLPSSLFSTLPQSVLSTLPEPLFSSTLPVISDNKSLNPFIE